MQNRDRPLRLADIWKAAGKVTIIHKSSTILSYQMPWEGDSGWAISFSGWGTIKQQPENKLNFTKRSNDSKYFIKQILWIYI